MKPFLLILVVVVLGIQFIRPEKNQSLDAPGPDDLTVMYPPSAEVQAVLEQACFDCHSNNTRYPWYAEIQPVGWWLADHVEEARSHFNFSAFGSYSAKKQRHKLEEMMDEVRDKAMPLQSYKLVHGDARLSDAQIKALTGWAEAVHDQLTP